MIFLLFILPIVSATTPIIPRELLFSSPKHSVISLSPDGMYLSYIAPDENNVENVFVKHLIYDDVRQVTFETTNNVFDYEWTGVSDVIIYMYDSDGDENTMLFKKNISKEAIMSNPKEKTVISNRKGVKAIVLGRNLKGSRVLVGLNDINPSYHNIYSFDLITDSMTLVMKNDRFARIFVDNNLNIRLASEEQLDGSMKYYRVSDYANPLSLTSDFMEWVEYIVVKVDDISITKPIGFDKYNKNMYWLWSDESTDLGKLVMFPFDIPQQKVVLYTSKRGQIEEVLFHPTDMTLLTVTEVYHKPKLYVANNSIIYDIQYLESVRPDALLKIIFMSSDIRYWLITYLSSEKPCEIFLYSKYMKKVKLLFNDRPELLSYKLNRQVGFEFKARDNVVIQAYISLPPDVLLRRPEDVPVTDRSFAELGMIPTVPQKLIAHIHDGPKTRDYYGFSPINVWLTNRGYAVLQVNYRGSTGFGKRFRNAGYGEFSRKMHHDILDAVEFVIAKNITNRSSIAIMGDSYGGYETLAALTFTPDTFACGVDMFGPSNLISLMETFPSYWKGYYQDFVRLLGGDVHTEEGRQSLKERSPLFHADKVKKPIIIFQGSNDPRVKQQESDQFVNALKEHNIPVSYVLFPDEGHGFRKASNNLAMNGFIEKFLYSCLGGRYEPYHQGQYNSSAILKSDGFSEVNMESATSFLTPIPPLFQNLVPSALPSPLALFQLMMQCFCMMGIIPNQPMAPTHSSEEPHLPQPTIPPHSLYNTAPPDSVMSKQPFIESDPFYSTIPPNSLYGAAPSDSMIPGRSFIEHASFYRVFQPHSSYTFGPPNPMTLTASFIKPNLFHMIIPSHSQYITGPYNRVLPTQSFVEPTPFQPMMPQYILNRVDPSITAKSTQSSVEPVALNLMMPPDSVIKISTSGTMMPTQPYVNPFSSQDMMSPYYVDEIGTYRQIVSTQSIPFQSMTAPQPLVKKGPLEQIMAPRPNSNLHYRPPADTVFISIHA